MTSTDEPIQELLRDPAVDLFAWKNVLIFLWGHDVTAEVLRMLGPVVGAKVREVGLVSAVNIVARIPLLPNEERRKAYNTAADAYRDKLVQVTIVLEGEGFLVSAVRGVITGLALVSRQRHPVAVLNSIDEVASWLPARHAALTGVTVDSAELRTALGAARKRAASSAGRPGLKLG